MRLERNPIGNAKSDFKRWNFKKGNQCTRMCFRIYFNIPSTTKVQLRYGPPKFYSELAKLAYSLRLVLARLLHAGHIVGSARYLLGRVARSRTCVLHRNETGRPSSKLGDCREGSTPSFSTEILGWKTSYSVDWLLVLSKCTAMTAAAAAMLGTRKKDEARSPFKSEREREKPPMSSTRNTNGTRAGCTSGIRTQRCL